MARKPGIVASLNGAFVGLMIFFTTIFGVITTQLIPFLCIFPLSRSLWKHWNCWASDTWYRNIIFWMEYWNGTKVRLSGDPLPDSENVMLMSNHPSEADWFFTWSLGWRKKSLGNVKVCIKKELQFVPGLGWAIDNLDYPFFSRKWEFDEALIKHSMTSFIEDKFRLWLTIFPEGTDFTEAKQKKSWELADINGWPKFKHLLAPRTKGLVVAVNTLRNHIDCVYDLTVGYPNNDVKRIPIKDVPQKEEELKKWTFDRFQAKDELLDYFQKHQKFPGASEEFMTTGPGLSPLISWICWNLMVFASMYGMYSSRVVAAIYVIGWIIFGSFAYSPKLRRWRGLDPPLSAHKKQQ